MTDTVHHLLAALFLLAPPAFTGNSVAKSPPEIKNPGINKIVQLTAREHSTILFSIADEAVGYAKDGMVEWINTNHKTGHVNCGWPHPALSHDGLRIAFVSDGDAPNCRIVIHDIPTGVERALIDTPNDPGEVSWSWSDAEIVFIDSGISAVALKDGVKRVLLPYPINKIAGREFELGTWYPMQWLHNGKDLVIELSIEISTENAGSYDQQPNLLLVSGGEAHVLDIGSQPCVPNL